MKGQEIIDLAVRFVEEDAGNRISREAALSDKVVGLRIYEAPIFAFGAADDPLFRELKNPAAIGPHFLLPQEWLPQAKTVISFFLPFTQEVKEANSRDLKWPADEWLHARYEGQAFLLKLCRYLEAELNKKGYAGIVPASDTRFWSKSGKTEEDETGIYTSNWSERHVAYVCGLGTFGLSRGLITRKGVAGRFGSIITDLALTPDSREYQGIYDYCSMCGQCVQNCPVQAISLEEGKKHQPCGDFLDYTREKCKPRYGCGKCQVRVPCESELPFQPGR